ncbi:hypothetical protein FIBSPDRAFT_848954 [Athelia psychrophila]|uniref:Uncharacterized protein n=1 Tax=Athelia psychrophila TaxID=1759441 RepID=A0A166USE9_9AGAM|nr:hypothetical protein FIBSPDRAFT_880278 [Fibularhizoctonia sp. CBS 109695]KZP02734.1 hypothetical protein FIBSPDRAFT_880056 [Fibularhizoctonia sp. CBS 109695]KZP02875.1 hypothetical protein FIBSPDRAFT_879957 [Fibularhizoctonia sp. CBS 109695]KZP31976.1 hypothetical protein FIBSPDRAFT_848954 [Fibularhizoctonia sp. CBS 109695]
MDPEGINMLMFAILNLLPLERLPYDSIRSTTSLDIAKRLKQRRVQRKIQSSFP